MKTFKLPSEYIESHLKETEKLIPKEFLPQWNAYKIDDCGSDFKFDSDLKEMESLSKILQNLHELHWEAKNGETAKTFLDQVRRFFKTVVQ